MSCESTRGTWGSPCPDCGQQLPPSPREWRGWRSEKIDPGQSERARLSSTGNLFSRIKRAQMTAARP